MLPRAPLALLPAVMFAYACIGAPSALQIGVLSTDALAARDTGPLVPATDVGAPGVAPDATTPVEPVVRSYSAPVAVKLQDSQLRDERLEITEPWFGASDEMYFRAEGFIVQQNFDVACDWPAARCRSGGQLQSFGANSADMIRPCTLGTAAKAPLRGPMLYGNGDTLFLQLPSTGDGRQRTLLEGATFAYVFPGTSDFSAISGKGLKVFRYTPGGGDMRGTVVESANWGRFEGSYHAADSASAPTLLVYTDSLGHTAARTRSASGVWAEAPELVKAIAHLHDARMTWMSADTSRIVFSARTSDGARSQMYTATR